MYIPSFFFSYFGGPPFVPGPRRCRRIEPRKKHKPCFCSSLCRRSADPGRLVRGRDTFFQSELEIFSFFFSLIKFSSDRRKIEKEEIFEISLIIVRRRHFFFSRRKKAQPTIYTRSTPTSIHTRCPHKRGITSVYPVQCLSVYLCPRLTPDPSRQTAQSRARKRGLCR